MIVKYFSVSLFFNVEEREDGWYFRSVLDDWNGPHPTLEDMAKEAATTLAQKIIETHDEKFNPAP